VGATHTLLEVSAEGRSVLLVCGNLHDGVFAIDPATGKISFEFTPATTNRLTREAAADLCRNSIGRFHGAAAANSLLPYFRTMSEADQLNSCREILERSADDYYQAYGYVGYCETLVVATLAEQGVTDPAKMHEGPAPRYCYEVGLLYRGAAWEWSRMARHLGLYGFHKAMLSLYTHEKNELLRRARLHLQNAGDSRCLTQRTRPAGGGANDPNGHGSSSIGKIAL
jgi:hypothetical protein